VAHDREVGLEIELEDAQRVFHVLDRIGDRDERDDHVAFLHVILDILAVDRDITLDKFEPRVAQTGREFVGADIHPVDFPVFLFEDGLRERAADKAVGAENENFDGHRKERG
jgi:hypothetical protein